VIADRGPPLAPAFQRTEVFLIINFTRTLFDEKQKPTNTLFLGRNTFQLWVK